MGQVKNVSVSIKLKPRTHLRASVALGLVGEGDFPKQPKLIETLVIVPRGWRDSAEMLRLVAAAQRRDDCDVIEDFTGTIDQFTHTKYRDMATAKRSPEPLPTFRRLYLNAIPSSAIVVRA